MKLLRSTVAVALLVGVLAVLAPAPAGATVNVNTTANELNGDGDCSLREAIQSVNSGVAADACGSTTGPIVLPAGTYPVSSQLTITATMTIRGAGAGETVIDTSGFAGTLFNLPGSASFTLEGVTATGGASYYLNGPCGPVATLTVNDSVLDGAASYGINNCSGPINVNGTTIDGSGSYGINNNDGDVSLTDSAVSSSGSYGVNTNGGSSTLVRSTVSASGDYGINANDGSVSLTDSALVGAGDYGINTFSGDITLVRSTVSDPGRYGINTAAGAVSLTNSTVSGADETAINNSRGQITLESSTVLGGGEEVIYSGMEAAMVNSIIVGGSAAVACDLPSVSSGGYNLVDDATCGLSQSTDLESTDPELGALADNGGPTFTHMPQAGSPAIDTGGDCPSDDQRSEPRPADGDDDGDAACDRGAVEIQPAEPVPSTTTTTTTGPTSPTAAAQPQTPAFTG